MIKESERSFNESEPPRERGSIEIGNNTEIQLERKSPLVRGGVLKSLAGTPILLTSWSPLVRGGVLKFLKLLESSCVSRAPS